MALTFDQCQAMVKQAGSLNVLAVLCWGRSGSIFLGSLLDDHPNLLTISQRQRFSFFSMTWKEVDQWLSRHPHLGSTELVDFLISILPEVIFRPPGIKEDLVTVLDHIKHLTAGSLFSIMHLVYENCLGRDLTEKRMINYQFHGPSNLMEMHGLLEAFPHTVCLGIHRDPFQTAVSLFNNFHHHRQEKINDPNLEYYELAYLEHYYDFWYRCVLFGWDPLTRYMGVPIHEVRLETLHAEPEATLQKIVEALELPWSDTLMESAFAGEVMVQHSHTGKSPNSGFQKEPKPPVEYSHLMNSLDRFVFQGLTRKSSNRRGYGPVSLPHHLLAVLLSVLPMKLEAKAFYKAFQKRDWQLLKKVVRTWRARVITVYRMVFHRRITGLDLYGDDLTFCRISGAEKKERLAQAAWSLVQKKQRLGMVAIAPANDLTRMLVNQFYARGLKPPPVFDLHPQKHFNTKIRAYEDVGGVDAVVICSPNYEKQIIESLTRQGIPRNRLFSP